MRNVKTLSWNQVNRKNTDYPLCKISLHPQTNDSQDYLYYELTVMCIKNVSVVELKNAVRNNKDLSQFNLPKELQDYIKIINANSKLHMELSLAIYQHVETFTSSSKKENVIFCDFIKITKSLFKNNNHLWLTSTLFASWIIKSLICDSGNETSHAGRLWKTRYEIIATIRKLSKNFTIYLEHFVGIKLDISTDITILVWVLLQTTINCNVLICKTKFSDRKKSEFFVLGLTVANNNYSEPELYLLTEPASLFVFNNEIYLKTQHYSTLEIAVHTNTLGRKNPQILDHNLLKQKCIMRLFINWQLLNSCNCNFQKFFEISLNSENAVENKMFELKKKWWNKKKQAEYQELFVVRFLQNLSNQQTKYQNGAYLKEFFDFRGRIYSSGPYSYTFNKIMRAIYYYGHYTKDELDFFENCLPDIPDTIINRIVNNTNIKLKYPNINLLYKITRYYIYIMFFEFGKIIKNDFIEQYEGCLRDEDFISIGIDHYNNITKYQKTFEKFAEQLKLLFVLEDLNNQIFPKIIIYKDATASVIQLMTILLGASEKKILKEVNLASSTRWRDTYYWIIERFKKKVKIPRQLQPYFNRSALKPMIMTYNYGAKYTTCLSEFKKNNKLPQDSEYLLNQLLTPFVKKFYVYLTGLFNSNEYFANPPSEIVEWCRQKLLSQKTLQYYMPDGSIIILDYFNKIRYRVERVVLSQRETLSLLKPAETLNHDKILESASANIIHSFDAYLVRRVIFRLKRPIITIHDSFGIDILSIPQLIKIVQEELTILCQYQFFNFSKAGDPSVRVESPFILL